MGYGSTASPGWGMCGIGKGANQPYVFMVRVGIGKACRRMYFWALASPPKDGGLSCAQSCRPASLRETGAVVMLLLLEIGVSERASGGSERR